MLLLDVNKPRLICAQVSSITQEYLLKPASLQQEYMKHPNMYGIPPWPLMLNPYSWVANMLLYKCYGKTCFLPEIEGGLLTCPLYTDWLEAITPVSNK